MKFIETKVHGRLDYIVAIGMIAAPWLFELDKDKPESWVFIAMGVITIVYSLITDYELGISPKLSMRAHLGLDTINGILLAASPWLFSFADRTWKFHVMVGIAELLVVLFSKSNPSAERKDHPGKLERWQTEANDR